MNTKGKSNGFEGADTLYRTYQETRAEQPPAGYAKALIEKRRHEQTAGEIASVDDATYVGGLYRHYQATRDERIEKGITSVMREVSRRVESNARDASAPRKDTPGLASWVKSMMASRGPWLLVPSLGVAALVAILVLPVFVGTEPSRFLAYPPSGEVVANAELLRGQLSDVETSGLGFTSAEDRSSAAFRAGFLATDLSLMAQSGDTAAALSYLKQLSVAVGDGAGDLFSATLGRDLEALSRTDVQTDYSADELLAAVAGEFDETALQKSYEAGQWAESMFLEALLAIETGDSAELDRRLQSDGTTSILRFISGRSEIVAGLVEQLSVVPDQSKPGRDTAVAVRDLITRLKYVY